MSDAVFKLKPLNWTEGPAGVSAKTPFGVLRVTDGTGGKWYVDLPWVTFFVGRPSREKAIQYAEASLRQKLIEFFEVVSGPTPDDKAN